MNSTLITIADSLRLDSLHLLLIVLAIVILLVSVWRARKTQFKREQVLQERFAEQLSGELASKEQSLLLDHQDKQQLLALEIAGLKAQINENQRERIELSTMRERYAALHAEHATVIARVDEQVKQLEDQKTLIDSARDSMLKDFQLTADRLFQEKQQQFSQQSETRIKSTLAPFAENLSSFQKMVSDLHHHQASERNQLVGQIGELQRQTSKVTEEANNLARALKGDNRQQGAWGEMVLEGILSRSGLEAGREYVTQSSYTDESARLKRPDVIINLPDERQLIIDSKVSIVDYERAVNIADVNEQQTAMKLHYESVKRHIKSLSGKAYQDLKQLNTLDYVMLFIPVESAYIALLKGEQGILDIAERAKVVIVGPSTLMSTLRTVEMLWQQDRQNQNALKIANDAGKLYDQFVLMTESIDGLEQAMNRSHNELATLKKRFGTGNGNLLKRFNDMKKLGVKTKKQLPEPIEDGQPEEPSVVSINQASAD